MSKKIEKNSEDKKTKKTNTLSKKDKKTTTKKQVEEKKEEKVFNEVNKKRLYLSFNFRFISILILFVISVIVSFQLIMMSFSIISERTIDYQEKSNIDYRVYLKENDFYDEEYLEEDMIYVSSLIKNIETDFKYNFNISEESNIKFNYNIVGKLLITDANGSKTFFEKEYVLLEDKEAQITNNTNIDIEETVKINYSYYNDLANRYRQQYGVNSKSDLIVSLNINKISTEEKFQLNNSSVMSINIPLAQNEVNIRIDSNELNNNSNVISKAMLEVTNIINIVIGIMVAFIAIILFVRVLRYMFIIIPKNSKYDKMLDRILKEYDRFIVETSTAPDEEHLKVVRVHKFIELLDVRDNLSQPIKYYNVTKHQKCVFYINYGDEIYIYTLKAVDIEEDK